MLILTERAISFGQADNTFLDIPPPPPIVPAMKLNPATLYHPDDPDDLPGHDRYAMILEEDGEGCDYMIGCGEVMLLFNDLPTAETIYETAESYGFSRIGRVTIAELVKVYTRDDLAKLAPEPVVDEEKEARRIAYEKLKREFG